MTISSERVYEELRGNRSGQFTTLEFLKSATFSSPSKPGGSGNSNGFIKCVLD